MIWTTVKVTLALFFHLQESVTDSLHTSLNEPDHTDKCSDKRVGCESPLKHYTLVLKGGQPLSS